MVVAWDLLVFHTYENRAIGSTFGQNTTIGGGPASVTTYDKQVLLKAVLDGDINPGRVFTTSYKWKILIRPIKIWMNASLLNL